MVAWPKDARGRLSGTGCVICITAVTKGACKGWDEGMAIYSDSTHPEHSTVKSIVDACCSTLAEMERGNQVNFSPSSHVESNRNHGVTNYMDVVFLSDSEVIKYSGLGLKALGLTPVSRQNEDGVGSSPGVYISFRGLDALPYAELMSLRKTRIWSEAGHEWGTCDIVHSCVGLLTG